MTPVLSGDAIHCACVDLYIMPELLARSVETKEGRTKPPGGLKCPGRLRTCAHALSPNRGKEKPTMAAGHGGPAAWINYMMMMYIFRTGEEGFNGVGSIKTDIYFALGWVSFAVSSISLYKYDISIGRNDALDDISKQTSASGSGQTVF